MKTSYRSLCTLFISALALPLAAHAQTNLNPASGSTPTIPAGTGSGATGASSAANAAGTPATTGAVRASMFTTLDSNSDGMVSRLEFEAYRAASAQLPTQGGTTGTSGSGSNGNAISGTTNFELLDTNSDGQLNAEEFARSSFNESAENFTGALRRMERPITNSNTPALGVATNTGNPLMFESADTNSDGAISAQEFARYHNAVNEGLQAAGVVKKEATASFQALDSNSDGKLTVSEFARGNERGDLKDGTDTTNKTTIETTTTKTRVSP